MYAEWEINLKGFLIQFIDLTDGFCTTSKKSVQSTLKASFDLLSQDDKQIFKETMPVIGVKEFLPEEIVVNAKSRYCYMISDYGYDDFLEIFDEVEEKVLMHRGRATSIFNNEEDVTSVILVTSLSILAITMISAYFVLRKRKEN